MPRVPQDLEQLIEKHLPIAVPGLPHDPIVVRVPLCVQYRRRLPRPVTVQHIGAATRWELGKTSRVQVDPRGENRSSGREELVMTIMQGGS